MEAIRLRLTPPNNRHHRNAPDQLPQDSQCELNRPRFSRRLATDEAQQTNSQAHRSGWTQHPAVRRLMKLVIAAVAVAGLVGVVQPAVTPAVAQAAVIQGPDKVGWGRAVILFNRDETLKIGIGGVGQRSTGRPDQCGVRCREGGPGAHCPELLQPRPLQRQQQLLIGLKTPQSFQLFQLVGQFGGQIRVVEPGADQALVDAMDVAPVVRL